MTVIMLFEFLIGLTDIWVAGRVGKETQATYGFVIQIYFIFIIIGNALSMGAVSVVSRLFASGKREETGRTVYSTLLAAVAAGVAFGAGGLLFTPLLISLVNIPPELKPMGVPLGRIYALGLLSHYVLINTNALLRACGRVKDSLRTMTLVCAVNIGANLVLVFCTPLGYLGIAFATATAVTAGALINIKKVGPLMGEHRKASFARIREISRIGWPAGLLQAFWQLHSMALFLILSALPGKSVEILAAFTTGLRVESVIFMPAIAFNMANAVVVGNLLGGRRRDEAFRGGLITGVMGVTVVSFLTLLVILGAGLITPLLSRNSLVVAETITYLRISLLSEPFMAWWIALGGALNGAGDTRGVMFNVALTLWLVRIPLSYLWVVVLGFGPVAVWWTMNLSQFLAAILITRRYLKGRWLG